MKIKNNQKYDWKYCKFYKNQYCLEEKEQEWVHKKHNASEEFEKQRKGIRTTFRRKNKTNNAFKEFEKRQLEEKEINKTTFRKKEQRSI